MTPLSRLRVALLLSCLLPMPSEAPPVRPLPNLPLPSGAAVQNDRRLPQPMPSEKDTNENYYMEAPEILKGMEWIRPGQRGPVDSPSEDDVQNDRRLPQPMPSEKDTKENYYMEAPEILKGMEWIRPGQRGPVDSPSEDDVQNVRLPPALSKEQHYQTPKLQGRSKSDRVGDLNTPSEKADGSRVDSPSEDDNPDVRLPPALPTNEDGHDEKPMALRPEPNNDNNYLTPLDQRSYTRAGSNLPASSKEQHYQTPKLQGRSKSDRVDDSNTPSEKADGSREPDSVEGQVSNEEVSSILKAKWSGDGSPESPPRQGENPAAVRTYSADTLPVGSYEEILPI